MILNKNLSDDKSKKEAEEFLASLEFPESGDPGRKSRPALAMDARREAVDEAADRERVEAEGAVVRRVACSI